MRFIDDDAIFPQQSTILFLKRYCLVMLFLILNIRDQLFEMGNADGKNAISRLP
jgi:hypothetical protein